MAIYLCVVSNHFPENYHIGVNARMWGVTDNYRNKLATVHPGDTLVFLSGRVFRSIHRIESAPFTEDAPLWPPYDGDLFKNRFKISPALFIGDVDCDKIWQQISFMRDKERWSGTVQGPNGVMNSRLTPDDLDLIKSMMAKVDTASTPASVPTVVQEQAPGPVAAVSPAKEPARTSILLLNDALQGALERLLPQMGLRRLDAGVVPKVSLKGGATSLVCGGTQGALVVVQLHRGQAPTETLLDLLFDMSAIRQHLERDVRGVILGETKNAELIQIIGAVPNVEYRNYRVALELAA